MKMEVGFGKCKNELFLRLKVLKLWTKLKILDTAEFSAVSKIDKNDYSTRLISHVLNGNYFLYYSITFFKTFFPVIATVVKTPENKAAPTPAVTIS